MSHYFDLEKKRRDEEANEIRSWLMVMIEKLNLDDLKRVRRIVQELDGFKQIEKLIKSIIQG